MKSIRGRTHGVFVGIAAISICVAAVAINMLARRNNPPERSLANKQLANKGSDSLNGQDLALDELLATAKAEDEFDIGLPDYPDETRADFEAQLRKEVESGRELLRLADKVIGMARDYLDISVMEIYISSQRDLRGFLKSGDSKSLKESLRGIYNDRKIDNQTRTSAFSALRAMNKFDENSARASAFRTKLEKLIARLAEIDNRSKASVSKQ
jgi:hypothetical protein